MADIKRMFYIENTDGTEFSTGNNPGAIVRLRNSNDAGTDVSEYTGNTAGSGAMSEVGNGVWSIMIDSGDNGQFRVETSVGAGWSAVNGYAPCRPDVGETLLLSGGQMAGNIDMNDNAISSASFLNVKNNDDEIGGIERQNLLDKTVNDTITADLDFEGDCTITTGKFDFVKDNLKIDSIKVSAQIILTHIEIQSANLQQAKFNATIFIADDNYEIVQVTEIHEIAEVTAGTMYIQLHRLSGIEAKCAGDAIFTDNSNAGLSLKTTAKTIVKANLHGSNKILALDDRICVCLSADGIELAGLHLTIILKRI